MADKFADDSATLEIEAAVSCEGRSRPLSEQVFYLLKKSAADIIPLIKTDHEKTIEELRSMGPKIIVTNSKGKAKISGLRPGTYFIFGASQRQKGFDVWNVQMELKPGENSLVLDNKNMAEREL